MNEELIQFFYESLIQNTIEHKNATSLQFIKQSWADKFWLLVDSTHPDAMEKYPGMWDLPEYKEAYERFKIVSKSPLMKALK